MRKTNKAKQRGRQQRLARKAAADRRRAEGSGGSARTARTPSRSHEAREAEAAPLWNALDGMAGLRGALHEIAMRRGEWAGIPMVLEGHPLIIEPSYPFADVLGAIGKTPQEPAESAAGPTPAERVRNTFWSWRWRRYVVVGEVDGKITWGPVHPPHAMSMMLNTLGAADAWGIEQEARAVDRLGRLIRHRQMKQYLLTGMFPERSRRSGVHYVFRRLRPTVALTERGGKGMRVLCTLCLHAIGYYENSWAGAMCPTDEVIAALMLMRGDEHMLWRRANQHPAWEPQSAL